MSTGGRDARYRFRRGRRGDAARLPEIERAAGEAFFATGESLGDVEPGEPAWFLAAVSRGELWVAVDERDLPVAFALFESFPGALHLEEIDVHPDHARRGLGAGLLAEAAAQARADGHQRITLTTFRHVPWNAPYYRRLGFRELPPERWTPELRARVAREAEDGLDPARRLVMERLLEEGT